MTDPGWSEFTCGMRKGDMTICSPVRIVADGCGPVDVNAKWDTGSSKSVVSFKVAAMLGLEPKGLVVMSGISGKRLTPLYDIGIILPNGSSIPKLRVAEGILKDDDFGLLIGMDVIMLGELTVRCEDGAPSFTFRMPKEVRAF